MKITLSVEPSQRSELVRMALEAGVDTSDLVTGIVKLYLQGKLGGKVPVADEKLAALGKAVLSAVKAYHGPDNANFKAIVEKYSDKDPFWKQWQELKRQRGIHNEESPRRRGRPPTMTDEQKELARDLHAQGLGNKRIAEQLGGDVSPHCVYRLLKADRSN